MFRIVLAKILGTNSKAPQLRHSSCGGSSRSDKPKGCGAAKATPASGSSAGKRDAVKKSESKGRGAKAKDKEFKCETRVYCQPKPDCEGTKFVSMWEPPPNLPEPYPFQHHPTLIQCCEPGCKAPLPRFDEMYYHPSCKQRQYQMTWVECPEFLVRKRKTCCYEKLEAIKAERRVRSRREASGCAPSTACARKGQNDKCPQLALMQGCRSGRRPPKCGRTRRKSCCRKLCAPLPSYSECKKPELADLPTPPIECFCRSKIADCQVLEYGQYVKKYKLRGPCPSTKKSAKRC
ncbi:uncharacterized protein LOC115634536 [Scaptodrosophila lebanonensis]|uniref:Uncharacterized protein LOC115634536 n=1 Tax=Drosophila lebanonensis TaxID=7225 RepID=A0A6J2UIG6_DROLE|nr:uncharacterized protein LOC115634536 [Scaptodrosophila lebanonensis]